MFTRNLWKLIGLAGVVAMVVACGHFFPASHVTYAIVGLGGLGAFMGSVNDSISGTAQGTNPAYDIVRQQHNLLLADVAYLRFNRPAWQVAAAAVAPPVLATATDPKTVKSTATTQMYLAGIPLSLSATDPLMLTASIAAQDPNALAVGSVRRWQICWDGTSATTVITIRPSNDQVIGAGTAAQALAKCRWPSLPPNGTGIVGLVDITNVTNPFIPGTTSLAAAGVTAACHDGDDVNCLLASKVTP